MKSTTNTTFIEIISHVFILVLLLIGNNSWSQIPDWNGMQFEQDANFYEIEQEVREYFEVNSTLKTTQGSGYKDFVRWREFWKDRVDIFQSMKSGSFQYAADAMIQLYQEAFGT